MTRPTVSQDPGSATFEERLKDIEDAHPVADHVLVGGLKSRVWEVYLPEEVLKDLRADMAKHAARAHPEDELP